MSLSADLSKAIQKGLGLRPQQTTSTQVSVDASTTANIPYGIATTTDNSGLTNVTYPAGPYISTDPNYIWTTGTGTTTTGISYGDTADFKKLKCKLPEGALEKLMTIGLIKSKKVLKQRIQEAFTKWCNTGEMEVSVFPMLLAACVLIMNDEDENKLKEEK
jgi:hypothetical protein